jgi:hypothetical protein
MQVQQPVTKEKNLAYLIFPVIIAEPYVHCTAKTCFNKIEMQVAYYLSQRAC